MILYIIISTPINCQWSSFYSQLHLLQLVLYDFIPRLSPTFLIGYPSNLIHISNNSLNSKSFFTLIHKYQIFPISFFTNRDIFQFFYTTNRQKIVRKHRKKFHSRIFFLLILIQFTRIYDFFYIYTKIFLYKFWRALASSIQVSQQQYNNNNNNKEIQRTRTASTLFISRIDSTHSMYTWSIGT